MSEEPSNSPSSSPKSAEIKVPEFKHISTVKPLSEMTWEEVRDFIAIVEYQLKTENISKKRLPLIQRELGELKVYHAKLTRYAGKGMLGMWNTQGEKLPDKPMPENIPDRTLQGPISERLIRMSADRTLGGVSLARPLPGESSATDEPDAEEFDIEKLREEQGDLLHQPKWKKGDPRQSEPTDAMGDKGDRELSQESEAEFEVAAEPAESVDDEIELDAIEFEVVSEAISEQGVPKPVPPVFEDQPVVKKSKKRAVPPPPPADVEEFVVEERGKTSPKELAAKVPAKPRSERTTNSENEKKGGKPLPQASPAETGKEKASQSLEVDNAMELLFESFPGFDGGPIDNGALKSLKIHEEQEEVHLRMVEYRGYVNFLNKDNQLISPKQWFVRASPFYLIESVYPVAEEKWVARVEISPEVFVHIDKKGDQIMLDTSDEVSDSERGKLYAYLENFHAKLINSGQHFQYLNPWDFEEFCDQFEEWKHKAEPVDFQTLIPQLAKLVHESNLVDNHKTAILLEILRDSFHSDVQLDTKPEVAGLKDMNWMDIGNYGKGRIVQKIVDGNYCYNLINRNLNFLYNIWFDEIKPFKGDVAAVRVGDKWNFIRKSNGKLVFEHIADWVDDIGEWKEGRLKLEKLLLDGKSKKYNYLTTEGELLRPQDKWFTQATDFKGGKAEVKHLGKPYVIGLDGRRAFSPIVQGGVQFLRNLVGGRKALQKNIRLSAQSILANLKSKPPESKKRRYVRFMLPKLQLDIKPREVQPKGISVPQEIHTRFEELFRNFENNPEAIQSIISLFAIFRQLINRQKTPNKPFDVSLWKKFRVEIRKSRLDNNTKKSFLDCIQEIKWNYIQEEDLFEWGRLKPLQVSVASTFYQLLKEVGSGEKAGIEKLIEQIQKLVNRSPLEAQAQFDKLVPEIRQLIDQSQGISKSTRMKMRKSVFDMLSAGDVIWSASFSMYRPSTPVSQITQITQLRKMKAQDEEAEKIFRNPQAETEFEKIFPVIRSYQWEVAQDEFRQLQSQFPNVAFDLNRLASAIYGLTYQLLEQGGLENAFDCMEMAMGMLEEALEMSEKLGQNREYCAAVYRNLGIIHRIMSSFKRDNKQLVLNIRGALNPAVKVHDKKALDCFNQALRLGMRDKGLKRERDNLAKVSKRVRNEKRILLGTALAGALTVLGTAVYMHYTDPDLEHRSRREAATDIMNSSGKIDTPEEAKRALELLKLLENVSEEQLQFNYSTVLELYENLGQYYFQKKNHKKAVKFLKEALKRNSQDPKVRKALILSAKESKQIQSVTRWVNKNYSGTVEGYQMKFMIAQARGRYSRGIKELVEALAIDPENEETIKLLKEFERNLRNAGRNSQATEAARVLRNRRQVVR